VTEPTDARQPTIVPLSADRRDDLMEIDTWAFPLDDEGLDPEPALLGFEWDRTFGAEVDGRLVGIYSVYSHRMPVPGGEVQTAGLTWVGVHPQFRRRGVLTAMIDHHFTTVHERGEPVSALFAAEAAIYGRFGYGLASRGMRMTLPRRPDMVDVPGTEGLTVRFERADADKHAALVAAGYDRARRSRPGMVSRASSGLQQKVFGDTPRFRGGAERLRLLVVEDAAGEVRGYALFRRKDHWEATGPNGTVQVREAVALDGAASAVLWSRLADLDLMGKVETDSRPLDDPLVNQLTDVRGVGMRVSDGLWTRLVDVGAALAARRYTRDVDVVLEVSDARCGWNAGRWRLSGNPDGARCERTSDPADLSLDVRWLSSAYLGGETLSSMAAAGLVDEHTPGAVGAASQAFAWHVAPYCGWVF
jgi:predicted acetyltransferase